MLCSAQCAPSSPGCPAHRHTPCKCCAAFLHRACYMCRPQAHASWERRVCSPSTLFRSGWPRRSVLGQSPSTGSTRTRCRRSGKSDKEGPALADGRRQWGMRVPGTLPLQHVTSGMPMAGATATRGATAPHTCPDACWCSSALPARSCSPEQVPHWMCGPLGWRPHLTASELVCLHRSSYRKAALQAGHRRARRRRRARGGGQPLRPAGCLRAGAARRHHLVCGVPHRCAGSDVFKRGVLRLAG